MKKGIILAGSMIVDLTYPIACYPKESELTTINGELERSTGGLACNVTKDLAELDPDLPLQVIGLAGEDPEGDFILSEMEKLKNVNLKQVTRTGTSSFTIVMNSQQNRKRTFFQYHGNNAYFDESYIDWENVNGDLFHVGYLLLLDALDREDAECGTKMAKLLKHAQERGLKTSIDVVTEVGSRFRKIVPAALRYTNYCIINEEEAGQVTGILLRDSRGRLHPEQMLPALQSLKKMGVRDWAVIHCPEGGYGLDENGNYVELPSLNLPDGYIKGSVGAGDAFCAGVLYGAEKNWELKESIQLGTCSAAASLSEQNATDGMRPLKEVMRLSECYS